MTTSTIEEIRPEVLYTLAEARRRLGWGDYAMRSARRAGLKVRYVAGRGYLLGRDVVQFIEETGKDSK